MKIHFITFAGNFTPNSNIHKAGVRICNQAKKLNLFDSIKCYTEEDLKSDTIFWKNHEAFINQHKKGCGLWLWKPYIIKKTLEQINNGECLVYCDCGCEVLDVKNNTENSVTKTNLINSIQTQLILSFGHNVELHRKCYTKQICYKFFKITEEDLFKNNYYYEANRIFLAKNDITVQIINEWWDIMNNHYELYDNSKTEFIELSTFRESRHDQMIYNFILHKHGMLNKNISFSGHKTSIKFNAYRNKSGISKSCKEIKDCICGCCVAN